MGLFNYPGTEPVEAALNEITLLADLSRDGWSRILQLVETRQFRAGEDLICAGERDDSFYILTAGEVDVIVNSDGTESVLATIAEGSVFGEIAFFDRNPRSATIRARTQGTAVRVTRENFDTLSSWEPELGRQMLFDLGRILAMRLRWTTGRASG